MTLLVKGPLLCAAENRTTLDGEAVLILTIKADPGWPVEARVPFGPDALHAAAYAARLPQGTHITVEAAGATPRSDHGRSEGCKRLEVSGAARGTAFNAARALGGACGPDARYLTIKGFDYSEETP